MGGDYTRFTDDARKRYAGVLMQQGRVQLDADWNEQVEIVKRRWQLQAVDTFGPRAVSTLSTPDAFKVTVNAGPPLDLGLGAGRMYVDGLLAEILPGEQFQNKPISYLNQPFLPSPDPLPAGGNLNVFLDVWEREVTYIEDPELLEKALGGPDTATRLQTVWQVKFAARQGPADCQMSFPPPSGGRLSTRAITPPKPDDPCIIAPSGGYRGLENRLYRVEIHTPGNLAAAKFKWSRDNSSVASAVKEITTNSGGQSVLRVSRIGRDKILRFQINDWVEITDNHRELKNQAGVMARIAAAPDEANLTVTLDRDISAAGFNPADETRRTRIRQWNQNQTDNVVDANGLVSVANTWLKLEDGVEVNFSLVAGSQFQVGDYWVFAARTADGSVEALDQAPPRGIIHHYAPLAAINGLSPTVTPLDCRTPWPPTATSGEGCCTRVVRPGEDIQAAIDSLPDSGGCVCLKTGVHLIRTPVEIRGRGPRANILLHGESIGATVRRGNGVTALIIGGRGDRPVANVTVESIRFEASAREEAEDGTAPAVVLINNALNISIRDCEIAVAAPEGRVAAAGVIARQSRQIHLERSLLEELLIGVWAIGGREIDLRDNRIRGAERAIITDNILSGISGIVLGERVLGPCRVERNLVENFLIGISVEQTAILSVVAENFIDRRPLELEPDLPKIFAIDAAPPHCTILNNLIHLADPLHGGVRVSGDHARVEGNQILSSVRGAGAQLPLGISLLPPPEREARNADRAVIQGNLLSGQMDGIALSNLAGVEILENRIEGREALAPRLAISVGNATQGAVVEGNQIRDAQQGILLNGGAGHRVLNNRLTDSVFGIGGLVQASLEVSDNVLERIEAAGLLGFFTSDSLISRNRFAFCGFRGIAPNNPASNAGAAVLMMTSIGEAAVESCEVLHTGVSQDGQLVLAGRAYGVFLANTHSCRVHGNRIAYPHPTNLPPKLDPGLEHRALFLSPLTVAGPDEQTAQGSALVLDNRFSGVGLSHLVEFARTQFSFEKVAFSNNYAEHLAVTPPIGALTRATILFWSLHLIVMGNHVKADRRTFPSMDLSAIRQVALVGNIHTGALINIGSTVPAPAASFNVQL